MRKILRTHNIKYLVTLRAKRFRINLPLATVSLYHSFALALEIINLSIIACHFVHYSKITSALVNTQSYYDWFPKANRTSWSFQSIPIHFHRLHVTWNHASLRLFVCFGRHYHLVVKTKKRVGNLALYNFSLLRFP